MRKIHRFMAVVAVLFGLYVGATGTLIQAVDLRSILGHAPPNDPDMKAIRDGRDGPPNFQVIRDSDFDAATLPSDFDFNQALTRVMNSQRALNGDAPMNFIELRMVDGKPVGQAAVQGKLLRFDALTGAALNDAQSAPPAALPPPGNQPSLRNWLKNVHRMTAYGNTATILFFLLGVALCVMLATGLILYFQLWSARTRIGRNNLFWSAGGMWRNLHRACALASSIVVVWVAVTGLICAVGSLGVALYRFQTDGARPGLTMDVSSPLPAAQLPAMLNTTLTAFRAAEISEPIKVVRLRYFAGMPQGVVVYGGPNDTRQRAYNAVSGEQASLSAPGYPRTGQTLGWQGDQIFKGLHRGDFIGLPGRWLNLIAGLALLFLSVSGAVMYFDIRKRQRVARTAAAA